MEWPPSLLFFLHLSSILIRHLSSYVGTPLSCHVSLMMTTKSHLSKLSILFNLVPYTSYYYLWNLSRCSFHFFPIFPTPRFTKFSDSFSFLNPQNHYFIIIYYSLSLHFLGVTFFSPFKIISSLIFSFWWY